MKIILIILLGFIILRCTVKNDVNLNYIKEIKNSELKKYIDFESEIIFMDTNCLNQFRNALHKIIWDKDKVSLEFGFLFQPIKIENKYQSTSHVEKFILFKLKELNRAFNSNNDTITSYEVYYLNSYSESLKPCYLLKNNTLLVDSIIDISPDISYLKNNCIMEFTRTDIVPGVFELYVPDSNEMKRIDSLIP
jgi:hypothetical protein